MTQIQWNKVTWYSKLIASLLFVALPFIGFYYGALYGKTVAEINNNPVPTSSSQGISYYSNIAAWQTDTNNTKGGFSIAYPIDFDAQDNYSVVPSTDWRVGGNGNTGIKYFSLILPRAFEPQTNFADATLTVGASGNDIAIKECLLSQGPMETTSTATVNGVQFTVFHATDAAAGNLYETTSYRTLHAGKCYAVEYTVHSSQIANYPASYGLRPYDHGAINSLMKNIIGTFKFL